MIKLSAHPTHTDTKMKLPQQLSFSQAEYAGKKKQTRRDRFLAEMEQLVPWERLLAVIAPHYGKPAAERKRLPDC